MTRHDSDFVWNLMQGCLDAGWVRSKEHDTGDYWSWIAHPPEVAPRLIQVHQSTGEVVIRLLEAGDDKTH